jgi:hypothetical protein
MSDKQSSNRNSAKQSQQCPNPQDRGVKAFPMQHRPAGLQNADRAHLHKKVSKGK